MQEQVLKGWRKLSKKRKISTSSLEQINYSLYSRMQENPYIHRKYSYSFINDRCGDIYHLSPIIATLYAIVSKIDTFHVKNQPNIYEKEIADKMKERESRRVSNRISLKAKELLRDQEIIKLDESIT